MDYSFFQELKNAGLPQVGNGFYINSIGVVLGTKPYEVMEFPEAVYIPTLEELIELCGGKMDILESYDESTVWVARSIKWSLHPIKGEGSTPLEAVSRLWLALNKK